MLGPQQHHSQGALELGAQQQHLNLDSSKPLHLQHPRSRSASDGSSQVACNVESHAFTQEISLHPTSDMHIMQAPSGLAEQATPAGCQALRPLPAAPAGRLQGNPLFNINAHLGLGGLAAACAKSPPKSRSLVSTAACQALPPLYIRSEDMI